MRFDLSPKPAYEAIRRLVKEKWHTDLDLSTNEEGSVDICGFYGDYDIEITVGEKAHTQHLTLDKSICDVIKIVF